MKPLLAGVVVTVMAGLAAGPATAGEAATPESGLQDVDGTPRSLEDLKGRVVILNFWATWCAPCREEMPALAALHRIFEGRGVEVVAASADDLGDRDEAVRVAAREAPGVTVWLGATTDDMRRLGLGETLPATAVIDREGRVVERIHGMFDVVALRAAVDRTMEGGAEGAPAADHQHHDEGDEGHRHEAEEGHRHSEGRKGSSLVPS